MGHDDLNARRPAGEAADATTYIGGDMARRQVADADATQLADAGAEATRLMSADAGADTEATRLIGADATRLVGAARPAATPAPAAFEVPDPAQPEDTDAMWAYHEEDPWAGSREAADATVSRGAQQAGRTSSTAPLPPQPQTQHRSEAQAVPRPVEAPPQYGAGGREGAYERFLDRGSHWSLKLAKVLVILFAVLFLGSCVATEFRGQAASLWGSVSSGAESAAEDESLTATGEGAFSLSGIADAVGGYLSDAKDATAKALGIAGKAVDAGSDLQRVADKAKDALDGLLNQVQGLGN